MKNLAFNLRLSQITKISLFSLFLIYSTGCVVGTRGVYDAGVGVGVDVMPPQIIHSTDSFVNVRVGPGFFASDAHLLAYDYCLNRGLYAYEFSPWAHSAGFVRDLRFDCRPNFLAPPIVYNLDRRNRFRYNYFQDYFRTHRPGYHYTRPSRGWWGRSNTPTPRQPVITNPTPRYSRDGRATTPASPWSYNPNKNNNRYQPRNNSPVQTAPSKPGWWGRGGSNATTQPRVTTPASTNSSKPGWFGGSKNRSTPSASTPSSPASPRNENPKSGGSFWGGKKSSTPAPSANSRPSFSSPSKNSSSRYSAPTPSRSSNSDRSLSSPSRGSSPSGGRFTPNSSPSRSSGGSFKPGWSR